MSTPKNDVQTEMWQGIDIFDAHDLSAFDDCFGQDDEFFDLVVEETISTMTREVNEDEGVSHSICADEHDDTGSKKRTRSSLPSSLKRRKSFQFNDLEDFVCDNSVVSELNTEAASVQSAQLVFMTPMELDQQLDQSMSRLALSMRRSELSREQVIKNSSDSPISNPFALSVLLGGSTFSGAADPSTPGVKKRGNVRSSGTSQLRSYINQVGQTI